MIEDIPGNYREWDEPPNRSFGIVAHVVRGSGKCDLFITDLTEGWRAAQLACAVRAMRKANVLR